MLSFPDLPLIKYVFLDTEEVSLACKTHKKFDLKITDFDVFWTRYLQVFETYQQFSSNFQSDKKERWLTEIIIQLFIDFDKW